MQVSVRKAGIKRIAAALAAFAIFAFNHGRLMTEFRNAPEVFYAESESSLYERLGGYGLPGSVSIAAVNSGDEKLGRSDVSFKLFNALPMKRIPAYIGERAEVVPGGDPVGISIYTDGVLVVGTGGFVSSDGRRVSPASDAGLQAGDVIFSVNGSPVASSDELEAAFESGGNEAAVEAERGGKRFTVTVKPAKDEGGSVRIGAWVRDSTVGVGTLSFCDPDTGLIAALGHPVIDADTGAMISVSDGKLVAASILGVTKGRQGVPGELHGTFDSSSAEYGIVSANTELGVFGSASQSCPLLCGDEIPVAFPDEVHTGEAMILSSASGIVEEYSCRIVKTGRQNAPAPKGIVVEITDRRLIELTGGIVQGMSGSPILQDGRIVGAVTHVFINDPLKGFGAYAYWMYKESEGGDR